MVELQVGAAGAGTTARRGTTGADAADPTAPPTAADVACSLWAGRLRPAAAGDQGSTDALSPTDAEPDRKSAPVPTATAGGPGLDSNALVVEPRRHTRDGGTRTAVRLGAQAAEASTTPRGVVFHRDVKPSGPCSTSAAPSGHRLRLGRVLRLRRPDPHRRHPGHPPLQWLPQSSPGQARCPLRRLRTSSDALRAFGPAAGARGDRGPVSLDRPS